MFFVLLTYKQSLDKTPINLKKCIKFFQSNYDWSINWLLVRLVLFHFCSFYSSLSFFLSAANINRVLFTSCTLENNLQKTIFSVKFLNIQKNK